MRMLQFLAGVALAIGLIWLGVTQYMGRPLYSSMPTMLTELPWSTDSEHPAHVPTALLSKACGDMRVNDDLVACLKRNGMKSGVKPDGTMWATYDSGVGFSPTVHTLSWTSTAGALPMQIDAVREP
jgi:hypothetical protein